MERLFESGSIIDLLLLCVAVEGVVLWLYRRRSGRGVPVVGLVANLAAGTFLLLAVGAALPAQEWEPVALFLMAALIAHVADLASRWTS